MQLNVWISGIAVLYYGALGNPIPDNLPLYSDFLTASSSSPSEFDMSSPLPFDSAADVPDFLVAPSEPLETDQLIGSPDTPVETIQDTSYSDPPRENSCGPPDPDFQPYSKRDGDICDTKQPPTVPPATLQLPDLEKLEPPLGSSRVEQPEDLFFQIFPIPGYTRVGDKENLCPMPKRRLCCLGPLSGNVGNTWIVINHCRGKN